MTNPINRNTEENFWSHVNIQGENECWEWQLSANRAGYGRFGWNNKVVLAHRLAYELFYGYIDYDLDVLHDPIVCNNPVCCNPHHLRLGTHTDNMRDSGKLNYSMAQEIKNKYETGHYTYRSLAKEYNVSHTCIKQAILERTWI